MRVRWSYGAAAKYDPRYQTEARPWFGRCWWFWFPRLSWNGGTWRDYCTDVSATWGCWWLGFLVFWRAQPRKGRP